MPDSGNSRSDLQQLQLMQAIERSGTSNATGLDRLLNAQEQTTGAIGRLVESLEKGFDSMRADQPGTGGARQNWREMLLMLVAVAGIGFSFYQILSKNVDAVDARISSVEAKTKTDSREIRDDHEILRARVDTMGGEVGQNTKSLEENSMIRNLQVQHLEQLLSLTWPKELGKFEPTRYFPEVGRSCGSH